MVQTIKKNTYRCHLCKRIYTSMKRALECEDKCLDDKNYEMVPRNVKVKMDGRKLRMIIYERRLLKNKQFFNGDALNVLDEVKA